MFFVEYKDLEFRVDALRGAHLSMLKYVIFFLEPQENLLTNFNRITKVYEFETYDYPVQIQESISELSSSIGYNITSFAASNLQGTSLPVPSPSTPPEKPHKTLPHALVRAAAAAAAATTTASSQASSEGASRLGKSLGLYSAGWEKIASARLDQDAGIRENFLHPWQTTLNASIAVAMKARQAVKTSRLELDAAKQT